MPIRDIYKEGWNRGERNRQELLVVMSHLARNTPVKYQAVITAGDCLDLLWSEQTGPGHGGRTGSYQGTGCETMGVNAGQIFNQTLQNNQRKQQHSFGLGLQRGNRMQNQEINSGSQKVYYNVFALGSRSPCFSVHIKPHIHSKSLVQPHHKVDLTLFTEKAIRESEGSWLGSLQFSILTANPPDLRHQAPQKLGCYLSSTSPLKLGYFL